MSPDRTREILALLQNQSDGLERRAARIVGKTDAPDVVQDMVLRLWHRARDHAILSPAYVARCLRNAAIDHLRRETRHRRARHLPAECQAAPSSEQLVIAADELARVGAALQAMPDRRRQIFLLNRNFGCSYAEIAGAMGLSYSTVEREIGRALAACRAALDP